jgi:hypothetical protein
MRPIVLGLFLISACSGRAGVDSATDESPPEGSLLAVPDSIPGELGGPCGVDYADCPTSEIMFNKFRNLKKSAFSEECENNGENGQWRYATSMDVPRLVNDHDGEKDRIKIAVQENQYAGDGQTEIAYQFRYFRNGDEVALAFYNTMGDFFIEASNVYKGGLETSLTVMETSLFERLNGKAAVCRGGVYAAGIFANPQCTFCYGLKIYMLGSLGSMAAGSGGLVGSPGAKAVIGGLAGTGTAASALWDCNAQCARGKCTQAAYTCRESCPPPPRCGPCGPNGCPPCEKSCQEECDDAARSCCNAAGGMCSANGPPSQSCNSCS